MSKKDGKEARRKCLAAERAQRSAEVEVLCGEALVALEAIRPEDRGRFVVWAVAALRDCEKGAKALGPAAMEAVRSRIHWAKQAWSH